LREEDNHDYVETPRREIDFGQEEVLDHGDTPLVDQDTS
jgi:hypothetical protein